jgi:glycosyltransferase involved in cell wall biosynthesis
MTGPAGPLITCVVPVYNGERFLRAALESILAQTYRPIEVIVVDAGSSDASSEIVRSFDDPVRLVRHRSGGPAGARNRGWREARGEFVAFLDQDDLWHPRKLELQLARFAARPELECSITHVQMFWDDRHAEEERRYREHPRMRPIAGYATITMLARRSLIERVGPLNPALRFADSPEWFVRAEEQGVVTELLPDVLTYHRLHADNVTRREARASAGEFVDLVKSLLDRRRALASRA